MKITIGVVLGFVLGFLANLLFSDQFTTKHHWKVIENYDAYVNDPANLKPNSSTGLRPGDPTPSLAALVAAGELSHVDLVLPTVPKSGDAERHWITFCQKHKEIVYATGNPSYTAFAPAGIQSLHLNIRFRDADRAVVQTLIRELEQGYAK